MRLNTMNQKIFFLFIYIIAFFLDSSIGNVINLKKINFEILNSNHSTNNIWKHDQVYGKKKVLKMN